MLGGKPAEFFRKHTGHIFKSLREFALIPVSDVRCNPGDRHIRMSEHFLSGRDPPLFHISCDRLSVNCFESGFQRGLIDQKLF